VSAPLLVQDVVRLRRQRHVQCDYVSLAQGFVQSHVLHPHLQYLGVGEWIMCQYLASEPLRAEAWRGRRMNGYRTGHGGIGSRASPYYHTWRAGKGGSSQERCNKYSLTANELVVL
jgi:hypothetical protein